MRFGICWLVLGLLATSASAQTVVTTSGTIQGFTAGPVQKFLGIPYAEPPVGSLRWARPVPKTPVVGTIDGTIYGPVCPQDITAFGNGSCLDDPNSQSSIQGGEDCLGLSVFRPAATELGPRPVMVWIHGGALTQGCAKNPLYDAANLAQRGPDGQVVVTIQYRLGSLGFFALSDLAAEDPNGSAGNYGLLDTILALEWVKDNAAAFGGDPANITVFGESAGGGLTCALLASPLADGLFQRGIVESGGCSGADVLEPGPGGMVPDSSFAIGIDVSNQAGCTNPATRLACMRALSEVQVIQAMIDTDPNAVLLGRSMSIDGYALTEQPLVMFEQNGTGTREAIFGSNANEMTVFTIGLSLATPAAYDAFVRGLIGDTLADLLLPLYPAAAFASPADAYRALAEDTIFVCPTLRWADSFSAGGGTGRAYHFTRVPAGLDFLNLRSFHGAELFYLFERLNLMGLFFTPDASDSALSVVMADAWASFAFDGDPDTTPAWPVYSASLSGDPTTGTLLSFDAAAGSAVLGTIAGNSGSFRGGRCAALQALNAQLDSDGDGLTASIDNCPFIPNSFQTDSAGVGAGSGPDGNGDPCQCGDADDDGDVDPDDLLLTRQHLANPNAGLIGAAGLSKCNVAAGGTAGCDVLDVAIETRALDLAALPPGLGQECDAAKF